MRERVARGLMVFYIPAACRGRGLSSMWKSKETAEELERPSACFPLYIFMCTCIFDNIWESPDNCIHMFSHVCA